MLSDEFWRFDEVLSDIAPGWRDTFNMLHVATRGRRERASEHASG
jgi:hypothetical protein